MDFLALFISLPTRQSAGRMRIWRALRGLGCATLRDGVYLLPATEGHAAALTRIAEDVREVQGTADLYRLGGRDQRQEADIVAQFERGADYARLLAAMAATTVVDGKTLRALRRELAALVAIDYFPGEAQRQTEVALAALEAAASGEPAAANGEIRRVARADFCGRTWATRKNLWVDRMASAWLILRFIDQQAKFLWLDTPADCPAGTVGFDFDGAAFTHVGGRVSFEVLMASFALDQDPALARLGRVVHALDVGGAPVADAAGIEAVLAGARLCCAGDDALLLEASRIFDSLYAAYGKEPDHD